MPLDINSPISFDDILGIAALSPGHPVFMLEGHGADSLVIKLEANASDAHVANNADVMAAVDPGAAAKVLTPAEKAALSQWANTFEGLANAHASTQAMGAVITELKARLNDAGSWTKLAARQLADLKHSVGNKGDIRKFAAQLSAAGCLEKLGEIVAADLFNGQNDRFNYDFANVGSRVGQSWGDPPNNVKLKHLLNVGNIFVAMDSFGVGEPVGLDAYDNSSDFKDWQAALNTQEVMSQWPGRLLSAANAAARRVFADDCIGDLELVLGPRNRKLPWLCKLRLGKNAPVRFDSGLVSGAAKIRALLGAPGGGALPQGLADRLAIL